MELLTKQDTKDGNLSGVTGEVTKQNFYATVIAVQAYSSTKNTTRYTVSNPSMDIRNLIEHEITFAGCNAANNGTFKVITVAPVSGYIYVVNMNGVAEGPITGTGKCEFIINKLHVAAFQSGLVPENYDATVCTYDIAGNMLTCKFYIGGASGTLICTLTMTYDIANNMLTAARS